MAKIGMDLFKEAKKYIPGGVNSPVRSFRTVGGLPVFVNHARGSKIYGECGREFIDYCQGFGALILGHAHSVVIKELKKTAERGTIFGTVTRLETDLAKLITEAIPSLEKVRLTNSGTEAVMSAIRLARAYTGRDKIIKFAGSYHGHADYLLDCAGVPFDFKKHTIVLEYNKTKQVEETARKYQKDIAAIIVEPVAANMGVVLPQPGFLETLKKLTQKYNIVLIFDEVITGFRVTYGGAQELFKVKPDLTCLGKIMGGGLPCAAYGGREEIMKLVAPQGPVYQAGTLSGNPLAVSAGITTLKILRNDNPYEALKRKTAQLCEEIKQKAHKYKINLKVNHIGSIFSVFFTHKAVIDYQTAQLQDTELFKRFFHGLLKEGIYLSPSAFEANFLSSAHTREDVEETQGAVVRVFKKLRRK